jgi:inorganic triphosphatase YgiF
MTEEIELKLSVSASDFDRIRRRAVLAGVGTKVKRLEASYFDTADLLLRSRGLGLRLRQEGKRWVQTLKADTATGGALSTRSEWESAARLAQARPQIDLSLLRGSPLPRLLARRGGISALTTVFQTRVLRTTWEFDYRGAQIEVALDVGALVARRDGRRRIEPVSELEIELKSGRPARLLELAIELVGPEKDAITLLPLVRSKAERGYALALGERAPTVKANAAGFQGKVTPDMRTTEVLRAVIAHGIAVVVANAEAVRGTYEPEHIHQARVALRRMRSAARLLDREQHDLRPKLAGELRWLTQAISAARDWDVLVDSTLPAWSESAAGKSAHVQRLLITASRRREAARAAAVGALSSPRFARAVLGLQRWTLSTPASGPALPKFAPRALGRAHLRLFEAARFLTALSPERRHRVRILAKRLRYALDVLHSAIDRDESMRYSERLALLQDTLGEMNDAAVAASALKDELRGTPGLEFRRWVDERSAQLLSVADDQVAELQSMPSPWR